MESLDFFINTHIRSVISEIYKLGNNEQRAVVNKGITKCRADLGWCAPEIRRDKEWEYTYLFCVSAIENPTGAMIEAWTATLQSAGLVPELSN